MEKILIVGSSGHALVVVDIVENEHRYKIFGLIDPFKEADTVVSGYSILGSHKDMPRLSKEMGAFKTIVGIGDNWDRYSVYEEIKIICADMKFASTRHPFSQVGKAVSIGEGSVVMPGAVINYGAQIGKFCIVNTAASIDHECIIDDFVSIAPGTNIGGQVKVGKYSSISLGAKIIQKVSIGKHVVVGAGAVVLDDLPDRVVAYGAPARIVRQREVGEKYF